MTPRLTLIHADLIAVNEIALGTVDVVFTSPPYMAEDGWSPLLMACLARLVESVLVQGGRFWMDFGQLREGLDRPWVSRAAIVQHAPDLRPWQTIAWVKSVAIKGVTQGHYQPIGGKKLLNYTWEPVFQFVKGQDEPPDLDRLAVGVPFADKTNLTRGDRGANGDLHCAGDTWWIPYETTGRTKKKSHRHGFPAELVRRALKVSGLKPDQTVLDPFMGGGTVAEVCAELGLNCIGIERDPENVAVIVQAWREKTGTEPKLVTGGFPAPWRGGYRARASNPHSWVIEPT